MINKLKKVLISLFMIVSMTASTLTSVNAWDSSIPHQFTRVKEIDYPEWWSRKVGGKQWSTYMCTYNGNYAYCLEASKNTPAAGNYAAQVIENNSAVRKLLYYGYGGPGYNAEIEAMYKQQLNACVPDDFGDAHGNYADGAYLFTHIWLSYAYSNDLMGLSLDAFNAKWPNPDGNGGYGDNILWGYSVITSKPDPSNGAEFSTGSTAKFSATFDKLNMMQVSNSVKFNASSGETVQIPLQDNVTLHIDGTTASQTGGTATVYGGQTFHLTAPLENSPEDYASNVLNSSAKGKFCALAISSGVGGTQTEGSWAQEPVNDLKYIADWLEFGYIDLFKRSSNEDMTDNNQCYTLKGAKYGIYSDDTLVDTVITDENGYAKSGILPVGDYTIKELEASQGYDLDETVYNVTVIKDQTVTANVSEVPADDPIGIEIVKNDAENLGMPQGDATLEGAEFTVKYYDGYYTEDDLPKEATRTWVLQTVNRSGNYRAGLNYPNSVIKDKSDELYYTDGIATLPLGTISIQETKAPKGYLLKGNKLTVTDTATGDISSVEDGIFVAQITEQYQGAKLQFGNDANQMVVQEKVKKQKIQIFKSGYRNGQSEVVKGLEGAEFTFKLKSEVDDKGWDASATYDVVTTNENGLATTQYLPFGEYLIRETKTPKDYYTNPDFTVSITKDHSEYENDEDKVKHVVLNNRPVETQLKLIKKDLETNKTVTLNSASFKIVADEDILDGGNIVFKKGDYITQKVGGKKYDTFTTNSKNVVVVKTEYTNDDDENGEVFLPLQFFAGKYHLEEVKVPVGFIGLGKTQSFELSGLLDFTKDEDGDPIYTVVVKDEQPKAQIKLTKTITDLDTDTDLVDRSDLSKIQFVLKAKEDIYSPVDGTLLFAKDDVITTENSGAVVNEGTEIGNGIYALSVDGKLDISNLSMGAGESSYYLQEVKTIDGCVLLDTQTYNAEFKQDDFTTPLYIKSFEINNDTTHFEFNKTDVTGDKEVEGATLTLTDKDGNVVDEWLSGKTSHSIEGLIVGQTYTLTETITANGYVKATSITFTVKNSKELETVTMKDKVVTFSKTDVTGTEEIEDAEIEVKEKGTDKVVDSWISTKDSHNINGLEEGKTYVLTEITAPDGYVKAESIEFTVTEEKVDQKVIMKDKVVTISKQDAGGKEVPGALIQIIDKDENVVDEWISGDEPHIANGLEEGKTYTLHEDLAPVGYNIANDFEFTVTTEKENQTIEMIDTIVKVAKTDENGKLLNGATLQVVSSKTKNIVDQWTTGQHIFDITDEMKADLKAGKVVSDEIVGEDDIVTTYKITPNKDSDDYTLMLQVEDETTYYNIDIEGNETSHMIRGLIAGDMYTLREVEAPKGYATAKDVIFQADEEKDVTLTMVDEITKVVLHKQDITTKAELEGASLTVTDKVTGKVIDSWISGKKAHEIDGLEVGKTYIMTEVIAPKNYKKAESVEFTVTDTGVAQQVYMYDELLPVKVKTGDDTNMTLYASAGAGSFALLSILTLVKKRKQSNSH